MKDGAANKLPEEKNRKNRRRLDALTKTVMGRPKAEQSNGDGSHLGKTNSDPTGKTGRNDAAVELPLVSQALRRDEKHILWIETFLTQLTAQAYTLHIPEQLTLENGDGALMMTMQAKTAENKVWGITFQEENFGDATDAMYATVQFIGRDKLFCRERFPLRLQAATDGSPAYGETDGDEIAVITSGNSNFIISFSAEAAFTVHALQDFHPVPEEEEDPLRDHLRIWKRDGNRRALLFAQHLKGVGGIYLHHAAIAYFQTSARVLKQRRKSHLFVQPADDGKKKGVKNINLLG